MAISQIPYGLLANGNYGVQLDPTTGKPTTSVVEVMTTLPAISSADNFDGRMVFETSTFKMYVYASGPTPVWNPLDGLPVTIGSVNGSPPTTPTPTTGELYWDSSTVTLFVWDGSAWVQAGGQQATKIIHQSYTGDGTQTTYGTGLSKSTTTEYVEAFWDGVRQVAPTDYTLTGTQVVFTSAPPNGVNVHLRSFETASVVQNAEIAMAQYTAAGGETTFNTGIAGASVASIFVYVNGILKIPNTDYTITQTDTTIVSLSKTTSTTALVTTSAAHGISVGNTVAFSGFLESQFNKTFTAVTVPSSTTFTIAVNSTDPTNGTPSPTATYNPAYVSDKITLASGLNAGDKVDIRSLRNVVATTAAGEANTLTNIGTGTSLVKGKAGVDLQIKSISAGANIQLNDTGSDISIAATIGSGFADRTSFSTNSYIFSNTETTSYLAVRDTTAPVSVNLTGITATPSNSGRTITIKDESGGAATNNITITAGNQIDGSTTPYKITTNFGAVTLVFDGTNWFIASKV